MRGPFERVNPPLGEVELVELDWTLKWVFIVLRHLQDLLLEVCFTLLGRDSIWTHQTNVRDLENGTADDMITKAMA